MNRVRRTKQFMIRLYQTYLELYKSLAHMMTAK